MAQRYYRGSSRQFALSVATFFFVPALCADAQSAPAPQPPKGRPLAIEDYYRVKTVGSPELSPDGRWVAYQSRNKITNPCSMIGEDPVPKSLLVSAVGSGWRQSSAPEKS